MVIQKSIIVIMIIIMSSLFVVTGMRQCYHSVFCATAKHVVVIKES